MDIREEFLKELRGKGGKSTNDFYMVYYHLFSIMEHENLTAHLLYLKEEVANEHWFYDFHKSMRQTDFCGDCFTIYHVNEQTESDLKDIEELLKILPKTSSGRVVDGVEAKNLGLDKEYSRYVKLRGKKNIEKRRCVSGHIDMILWNSIHADKEGVLEKFIPYFFKLIELDVLP